MCFKKIIIIVFILLLNADLFSQTTIAEGFEGAPVWSYTTVGTVNNELARTGTQSLRLGRNNISCPGPLDGSEIIFDPVTIIGSACSAVFTFYHRTQVLNTYGCGNGEGMDSREGFAVFASLNNGPWTLLNSFSAFSNGNWNWTGTPNFVTMGGVAGNECGSISFPNPFVYNVPAGTTLAQFKIITLRHSSCANWNAAIATQTGNNYDRADEGFFIDDVSFTTLAPCILPVTLTNFKAISMDGFIQLNWHVAVELNVSKYIVERSFDGLKFEQIAEVKSTIEQGEKYNIDYTAFDYSPKNGVNYYRLLSVDNDGKKQYSNLLVVNYTKKQNSDYTVIQTEKEIIVSFESHLKNSKFVLSDIQGKKVTENNLENKEANYFKIEKSNLPKGLYLLSTPDNPIKPQKIIVN